jgi:hypothetical protein
MMVLTNRADKAAPLWQAAVAVLAEVASMAHAYTSQQIISRLQPVARFA